MTFSFRDLPGIGKIIGYIVGERIKNDAEPDPKWTYKCPAPLCNKRYGSAEDAYACRDRGCV